jgi:hypothetical protein
MLFLEAEPWGVGHDASDCVEAIIASGELPLQFNLCEFFTDILTAGRVLKLCDERIRPDLIKCTFSAK